MISHEGFIGWLWSFLFVILGKGVLVDTHFDKPFWAQFWYRVMWWLFVWCSLFLLKMGISRWWHNLIREDFGLKVWKFFKNEECISVSSNSHAYIRLAGIRKIGKTYYIQNVYNVWIKVDTPHVSEDGKNVVQINLSGVRKTLMPKDTHANLNRDTWIDLFAQYNYERKCYFFKDKCITNLEKIKHDEKCFDHNPLDSESEVPVYARLWLKLD